MSLYANRPLPEQTRARIVAAYQSEPSLSLADLATRFGVSPRAVSDALDHAGVRAPKRRQPKAGA